MTQAAMNINYLDLIIIIPVLYGIIRGIMRGFIFEIIASISIFAALFLAIKGSDLMNQYLLDNQIISEKLSKIWAFAIVFIVVIVLLYFIGKIMEQILKAAKLDALNRILGGLTGGIKLFFIACILLHYLDKVDRSFQIIKPETKDQSLLYTKTQSIKNQLITWIYT